MDDQNGRGERADAAPLEVLVHFGAHKTASTHFNLTVRESARASGVNALWEVPQDVIRERLTWHLSAPPPDTPSDPVAFRTGLLPEGIAAEGIARLFISDENIIGTTERLLETGHLYPRAFSRVERMLDTLGRSRVRCLMSIRNPGHFVASAYAESVRSGRYLDSATYLAGTPLGAMRWGPLLFRLVTALKGVPLTVWCYEDYHALMPDLLDLCMGDLVEGDMVRAGPKNVVRPGLSQTALDVILQEGRAADEPLSNMRIWEILSAHPKSEGHPAPQVFTPEQQAWLTDTYRQDIDRIRNMPGVTFLQSPGLQDRLSP